MEKKQKVRTIYKVGGFLAFIMLGYLGIRGYKNSVERLKINGCIEEIGLLSMAIQDMYVNQRNYGKLDYKELENLKIVPKRMLREGYNEITNAYLGGVDIYATPLSKDNQNGAFEISFQGLSKDGCVALLHTNWGMSMPMSVAIAGYPNAQPAGVLEEIYLDTAQEDIKSKNQFKIDQAPYVALSRLEEICNCSGNTCTVVWKFQ